MKIAVYPGTFDPVTRGHVDIIERSAKLFDRVVVLIVGSYAGKCFLDEGTRLDLVCRATAHISNVSVDCYQGLLAEYAGNIGADTIIKGLRAVTEFEYEMQQALINKQLNPRLETLFMIADARYMYLTSGIVKEVARYGGDVTGFLPASVCDELKAMLYKANL